MFKHLTAYLRGD